MMNRAVRGKSARTRSTTSATSPAPDQDRDTGRWRERAAGRAKVPHQRPALVAVRAERGRDGERRQVAPGRRGQSGLDIAVAGSVRVTVEERVLAEGHARI